MFVRAGSGRVAGVCPGVMGSQGRAFLVRPSRLSSRKQVAERNILASNGVVQIAQWRWGCAGK